MKYSNLKCFGITLVLLLSACGGGGGGGGGGPTVTSTTYSGATQTVSYSNGTTTTNAATTTVVSYAADHITRTTTYTFANGATNPIVDTVQPTISTPAFTAAIYPANWTTTGTVSAPSVTNKNSVYGDGFISVESGTSVTPFLQTTLSGLSITDPNAYVSSSTTTYNLNWGMPDKSGPSYVALFPTAAVTFSGPFTMWNQTVSGQGCSRLCGATIGIPHPEVIEAWGSGWTGKGVNILMEDGLNEAHGITTTLLAGRYAIGSTFYGLQYNVANRIFDFDGALASPSSMTKIGVINASHGAALNNLIGHLAPWTNAELSAAATAYLSSSNNVISRYTGSTTFTNFNFTDAVITKAAGNDRLAADKEPLVKALASNLNINSRLLIVGALNQAGLTSAPATTASAYTNTAGTDPSVQSRFLVASGNTPFSTGWLAVNGVAVSATTLDPNGVPLSNVGTSYAAPRVAGYVAIVRSKFPNLDAIKTSSIMLDTARYDTLSCNPNCDPTIYGKGEASLSRALAPVGRLR